MGLSMNIDNHVFEKKVDLALLSTIAKTYFEKSTQQYDDDELKERGMRLLMFVSAVMFFPVTYLVIYAENPIDAIMFFFIYLFGVLFIINKIAGQRLYYTDGVGSTVEVCRGNYFRRIDREKIRALVNGGKTIKNDRRAFPNHPPDLRRKLIRAINDDADHTVSSISFNEMQGFFGTLSMNIGYIAMFVYMVIPWLLAIAGQSIINDHTNSEGEAMLLSVPLEEFLKLTAIFVTPTVTHRIMLYGKARMSLPSQFSKGLVAGGGYGFLEMFWWYAHKGTDPIWNFGIRLLPFFTHMIASGCVFTGAWMLYTEWKKGSEYTDKTVIVGTLLVLFAIALHLLYNYIAPMVAREMGI
jgi:hypothetical protein